MTIPSFLYKILLKKLAKKYDIGIAINKVKLKSLFSISLNEFTITKPDLIINIPEVRINISLFKIIKHIDICKGLIIHIAHIKIEKKNDLQDFHSESIDNNINRYIYLFEEKIYVLLIKCIKYRFNRYFKLLSISKISILIKNREFLLYSILAENEIISFSCAIPGQHSSINFNFRFRQNIKENNISFKLNADGNVISFCNGLGEINYSNSDSGEFEIISKITIENIKVNVDRLAEYEVFFSSLSVDFKLKNKGKSFILAEESSILLENIPFSVSFIHDESEIDIIKLILYSDIDSQLILQKFPFVSKLGFQNVSIRGNMFLRCRMIFNLADIYEYFFCIDILENNIVIENLGDLNFDYLKKSFIFQRTEEDGCKIDIPVTEINSGMLDRYEKNRLPFIKIFLFSEDPDFYKHNGIDIFFIGYALVTNLASAKFARGGSTISMQLVRNLYLNFNKNLARKLEEFIIAIFIENVFNIPKDRILELYFSIIEFGPGIYGIDKGALFYFGKLIQDLTLIEIIVITYIVPRPVHFYNALLEKSPQLVKNLKTYIPTFSKKLENNNIISVEDNLNIGTEICFTLTFGSISLI